MEYNTMRIENMTSSRGNKIANQFEIHDHDNNVAYFQSYNSIIVKNDAEGQIWLDKNKWDYSVTTGKYRNLYLGENKAETLKKIKSGVYKLTDLNNKAEAKQEQICKDVFQILE